MKFTIETRKVNQIPILDVYDPGAAQTSPIIIFLHGFTSCKENQLPRAYYFARQGFYVTLFDAYQHGELEPEEFKRLNYFQKTAASRRVPEETMNFLDQIIADHTQTKRADSSRIGLCGWSMGGTIIYEYLTRPLPTGLKTAVPIVASPQKSDALKVIYQNDPQAVENFGSFEIFEAICQKEQEYYPKLLTLNDFPLLMLNGVNDPEIPIDNVRNCYEEMKQTYRNPTKINFIEYPGVKH